MTNRFIKKYDARIEKGIQFLDKKFGRAKWSKKIRVGELDLSSPSVCMIGEIMGNYHDGVDKLGKTHDGMAKLAFALDEGDNDMTHHRTNYQLLTRLWIGALYKLGIKG